jgi:hypothetical protein
MASGGRLPSEKRPLRVGPQPGPPLHHIALTITALAIHAVTAAAMRKANPTLPPAPTSPDDEPPADPGPIVLTVAEVKRLANLITRTWHTTAHHLRWAWWRRRHQARAPWFHQRTRLRREPQPT